MTTIANLNGRIREERGKGPNRRLRVKGGLPGVIYGGKDNISFITNPLDLTRILDKSGINALIDLSIEGDSVPKRTVLLKEAQMHPYKDVWIHADFYEINLQEKIKVKVPIRLVGHSLAEKQGALVEHFVHDLEIQCLPGDIPESIDVDMTGIELDQVVHISDLKTPENAEVFGDPKTAVVSVHLVKVKEEKAEEEEGTEEEGTATAEEAKTES